MITQVSIKNLRGIAEGTVSGITPLTILTGVNGSGKSTVLDALLIGANSLPAAAITQAVNRRASRQSTAEWLFRTRSEHATLEIQLGGVRRFVDLSWMPQEVARNSFSERTAIGAIEARVPGLGTGTVIFLELGGQRAHHELERPPPRTRIDVRLIDMRGAAGEQRDLTDVLTEAKSAGFGASTVDLLSNIVPGLKNLEILKVGAGYEVGAIYDDAAIPLSMGGDGVRSVARLALELAALPNGLALLEEPEVHQHPGALKLSAATIVSAVKRGLQIVVATHSLELIDELLLSASKADLLDQLSVQKLRLTNGRLETTVFSGAESDKIRNVIGTELR